MIQTRMAYQSLEQRLIEKRIVPVAVIESVDDAVPLAKALAAGGLPMIEVTLRTPVALDCIRAVRKSCPEILVGAGTVLTPEQVGEAMSAGAEFGVSPGLNEDVVRAANKSNWYFIPGVMTPSDVERAMSLGRKLLKFYPADTAGGVKMLKTLSSPYEHTGVKFVPLGGISAATMADYLALPIVAAVGGSWLCDRKLIGEKRWSEITALVVEAIKKTM
jgi:2-dehydro-3-deoxyphosphogluconate aldolase/(4S)-4-hydroxy-2-oxoglutarate aldolase